MVRSTANPGPLLDAHALSSVLTIAERAVNDAEGCSAGGDRLATLGTVRGTGPGVSFGRLVEDLEDAHPLELRFPFEGSPRVGGAVWDGADIIDGGCRSAAMKLRWLDHADDLPMHAHEASDRFIVVLEGRGFFHFSQDPVGGFDPASTRTIAVRERDALAFTRGVVHTFSTAEYPMTLLSVHLPFVALDDPKQYTLPERRWVARDQIDRAGGVISVGRWSRLV